MSIIDVIKFRGIPNRDWLIYRYPGEDFSTGSQLIVNEGQVAIFVKGGRALDLFLPGTYTLSTNNIPFLKSFINIPFGGRTPFTAEVFFINTTAKLDILWGTTDPISLIDPKYNVKLRVRAFGQFAMKIMDYRLFLTEIIGAVGDGQVVKYDIVTKYFRGVIVSKIKTIISDIIINQRISVLEITPKLEDISKEATERIAGEFNRFGINIINFFISSINFPDEDFDVINKILGEKAAFDIIGDNRYNIKRSFDVMETAAGNEGGGSIASAGIGLGLGAGAGLAVANTFATAAGSVMNTPGQTISCRKCGVAIQEGVKYCSNCGEKASIAKVECFSCKTLVDENVKFCPGCGNSMQKRVCPNCNAESLPGTKFCPECGTKLED
ncbi:MAG: SPFH domain-containing protein [Tissierellales bacterium]